MKITHKFTNIDGSEGTRSNSEDFGTVNNRFLKRIFDIVGGDNKKLLEEISGCLNEYNRGNYEKTSACLSQIIKTNPAIADELEPFQEICFRVLSCEKNDTDLLYEKYIDDLKNWKRKSLMYKLYNRKKKPNFQTGLMKNSVKIRCKHCGHYTSYISPNAGFAYFGSNNCEVCDRGYPVPSVDWDNIDGQAYIFYRGSVTEKEFYDDFERKHSVSPGRDHFMKKTGTTTT